MRLDRKVVKLSRNIRRVSCARGEAFDERAPLRDATEKRPSISRDNEYVREREREYVYVPSCVYLHYPR